MKSILVFLLVVVYVNALKRPDYIKPCSRKDPELTNCILEHAKYAIPFIVNGDKALKIPNMKPLNIPLVTLETGRDFKLVIKDMEIHGLEDAVPKAVTIDFNSRSGTFWTYIEKLTLLGQYTVNGKLSALPLSGEGPLNITLVGGEYRYDYSWEMETRDGVEYAKPNKGHFDYTLKKIYYDLKNLFSGDKLGEEVNKFLNENWKDVDKDLKAPTIETMAVIYHDIVTKFYSAIPYNELFLD